MMRWAQAQRSGRRGGRCSLLLTLVTAFALASPLAMAQTDSGTERYRVRKGDSLELLAAEYYGNRVHKIYIMVENDLDHDRPLKPGERLRIPVSQRITTKEGDTLEGLAKTYLGSPDRARYLAEFNNLAAGATLPLGQEITVPMRVTYRAKNAVKLRDVALGLFADAKRAALLRDYNGLDSDVLEPGQAISVPVPKVQVQPSKRPAADAGSMARAAKRRAMSEKALKSIPQAQAAWRSGDYARVKFELTKLDLDYLDSALATEAGILLGSAYIAFQDEDSALAIFTRVQQRNPGFELDEKQHSPKVRALWAKASQ